MQTLPEFTAAVEAQLQREYGVTLADTGGPADAHLVAAWATRQTPADVVAQIAEKYDLTPHRALRY